MIDHDGIAPPLTMTFELKIDCDNDAFEASGSIETARILRVLAAALEDDATGPWPLLDENGNRVGFADFVVQAAATGEG